MRGRGLILGLIVCVATACSHVRSYPVCLYDTDLGAAQQARTEWPAVRAQLVKALALAAGGTDQVVLVSSRIAIAKTSEGEDVHLQRVWPAMACYGASGGTASGQLLSACTTYVKALMESQRKGTPLSTNVAVPACQTYPPE